MDWGIKEALDRLESRVEAAVSAAEGARDEARAARDEAKAFRAWTEARLEEISHDVRSLALAVTGLGAHARMVDTRIREMTDTLTMLHEKVASTEQRLERLIVGNFEHWTHMHERIVALEQTVHCKPPTGRE